MKTRFHMRNVGVRSILSTIHWTVRSTKPTARPAWLAPAAVTVLLALAMALGAPLSSALAQTRYSVEGANQFRAAQRTGTGSPGTPLPGRRPSPITRSLGTISATATRRDYSSPRRRSRRFKRSCSWTLTGTVPGEPLARNL